MLNWYAYCGNNPVRFVDPFGRKYIPLRETIESLGGTVLWNATSKVAMVTLDGQTIKISNHDCYGNFIDATDGKMYQIKLKKRTTDDDNPSMNYVENYTYDGKPYIFTPSIKSPSVG